MKNEQLHELLYQSLETEAGGVQVYETAIRRAVNQDLKEEWQKYLKQTRDHEHIMRGLVETMGLDPAKETPGRQIVRHKGESLVEAMNMALKTGKPEAAQLVASECVVTAETKDHQNWELMSQAAEKLQGEEGKALKEACGKVEMKKTNTSTIPWGGVASCGLSRWDCLRCFLPPRRKRMSSQPEKRPARRSPGTTCLGNNTWRSTQVPLVA